MAYAFCQEVQEFAALSAIALRVDRLKAMREKRGLSQRELSRRCGLAENTIGRYEAGQIDPTVTSLKTVVDELDTSLDYLVGITDDPRRPPISGASEHEEQQILETFRCDGWSGVAHLLGDQLAK